MSDEIRSFKKVEDHIKRILAIIDKHTQMIEVLETHWRVWMNSDKDAHDEIASLREKLKLERKVKVWDAKVINRMNKKLNSLKEEVKRDFGISNNSFILHFQEIIKNREVLRELFNHIGFNEIKKELDPFYIELLAKLYGKKKVEKTDALDSMVHALYPLINKTEKKDWFENGWCSPYWKAFKQHSKPPEPITEISLDGETIYNKKMLEKLGWKLVPITEPREDDEERSK